MFLWILGKISYINTYLCQETAGYFPFSETCFIRHNRIRIFYDRFSQEFHPLEPFLPEKAEVLMLGSFPPRKQSGG